MNYCKLKKAYEYFEQHGVKESFTTTSIPLNDQNWQYNFGGSTKNLPNIVRYNESDNSLVFKMCNWDNISLYSGNISYGKKMGFGNYSIIIRPDPGGQILTAFYLSRPPENAGKPNAKLNDGYQEIDFEITTWPTPRENKTYYIFPTSNIWNNLRQYLDNDTKNSDGTCRSLNTYPQVIPFDYSVVGGLRFTIGWYPRSIIWTIEDNTKKQVYKRVLDFNKNTDSVTYYNGTSSTLDTNIDDLRDHYSDPESLVVFLSLARFPSDVGNWLNCQPFDMKSGSPDFPCDSDPPQGWGTIFYGPLEFTPYVTFEVTLNNKFGYLVSYTVKNNDNDTVHSNYLDSVAKATSTFHMTFGDTLHIEGRSGNNPCRGGHAGKHLQYDILFTDIFDPSENDSVTRSLTIHRIYCWKHSCEAIWIEGLRTGANPNASKTSCD